MQYSILLVIVIYNEGPVLKVLIQLMPPLALRDWRNKPRSTTPFITSQLIQAKR